MNACVREELGILAGKITFFRENSKKNAEKFGRSEKKP